jgi:serine/threonine protein kinase
MLDRLIVLTGSDATRDHHLDFSLGPVIFGRSKAQANCALPDLQVSRVHFQIEKRGEQIWVVDQGSSGGTLVNGRKVSAQQLKAGDIIRAGETQLRFVPVGADSTVSAHAEPDRLEALAGTIWGRFQVGPLLARGSSGCVFKAQDTETGQTVALKVLFPELAKSEEEMQRFIRTMKTIMPLSHPNLIALLGAGRKGSNCWASMEYIEGESLAKLIERYGREGKLPWKYSLRVAVHIARALNYGYQHNIIHRNITPNNILVRTADQTSLLGDLMLAKALEGTLAEQITKPGQMIGELNYMSPERTRSATNVDCRSDLYSLGATLYVLLTGKLPHGGLTLAETLQHIRSAEPQKPSIYVPQIPPEFETAILKMLAKEPAKRFQTPAELIAHLEPIAKRHAVAV